MLKEHVVRNISAKYKEPKWLLEKRLEAWKKFNQLDIPRFVYGIGIYASVNDLKLEEVDPNSINEDEVVVTNDEDIEVLRFDEALSKYEDDIRDFFVRQELVSNGNKFEALHGSCFNSGLFIRIPEGKIIEKPIMINLDLKSKTRIDYILIIAEKNSSANIIESTKSDEKGQMFRSQIIDIVVKENSKVEFKSIQNLGKNVYNFIKRKGHVGRSASLLWVDCCIGSKFTQNNTRTYIEGEGGESRSWGVAYGDQNQCYDINGETIHLASRTTSDMMAKVVLNDKAKTIYRGLVKINPGAKNCEGYQQEHTILLSQDAQANTVPNLEIENNEVKCSHGATITQIDKDKLFYMMSRGMNEITAKRTIIEGFFDPVIVSVEDEELRDEIKSSITKRLEGIQ